MVATSTPRPTCSPSLGYKQTTITIKVKDDSINNDLDITNPEYDAIMEVEEEIVLDSEASTETPVEPEVGNK